MEERSGAYRVLVQIREEKRETPWKALTLKGGLYEAGCHRNFWGM